MEQVDDLVEDPDARREARDRLPSRCRLADLLCELAPCRLERRLALDVEPAGRDLEEVGVADGLARLAHEEDVLVVVGHDPGRALVAHDLALDLLAVCVAEALDAQRDDAALVDGLAPDRLEASVLGAHARIPPITRRARPAARRSRRASPRAPPG
jgi:hypothetical protein